jgi:glycosyltransferase involved in cell wall biosynthesis
MSDSLPKVTWMMPVKNGMPYLTETLESIARQDYPHQQIFVWENGSTDGTLEELHRWIPSRIPGRVFSGNPLFVGAARAELVRQADTEFCAPLDADDIHLPGKLRAEIEFLLAHPEVAAVGSQATRIDRTGKELAESERMPQTYDDIVHRMLCSWTMWQTTLVFRRSKVLEAGNYREDIHFEDYEICMRLANKFPVANLPLSLIKYRVLNTSVSRATPRLELVRDMDAAFRANAPLLFGCTEAEAARIHNKRGFFLFPVLWRIAGYLSRKLGGTQWQRMVTPTFLDACDKVVRRRDFASLLLLRILRLFARPKSG